MRDVIRHPEPTAADLGVRCLHAVTLDERFDHRVREQAEQLLLLCGVAPDAPEAPAKAGQSQPF